MNVHYESDWRTQLDNKYNESEYNKLLPNNNYAEKLNKSLDSTLDSNYEDLGFETKIKSFDAIRFPPCAKMSLPSIIDINDFKEDYTEQYNPKKGSLNSSDSIAGLDFLEALFQTVVEKAVDVRSSILEHGKYIYFLSNPPAPSESEYMKSTLVDNLMLLRDESLQLIKEMAIFQTDKVNDMIHADIKSGKEIIIQRKASLFKRSAVIKHEITESAIVVDNLIHYSNSIINFPTEVICRVDGIFIDWVKLSRMQQKILTSNRSMNYAAFMVAKGFPVCNAVFQYLQSTKSYGSSLHISHYKFQSGEFRALLEYFETQHRMNKSRYSSQVSEEFKGSKDPFVGDSSNQGRGSMSLVESMQQFSLVSCDLNDQDCHALASKLHYFHNLHTLTLRSNNITYSGISSLATAIFETGSLLHCLRLDGNAINSDGAHVLSEVLHRMPCLETLSLSDNSIGDKGLYYLLKKTMNIHRKSFKALPKPILRRILSADPHDEAAEEEELEELEDALENEEEDDQLFRHREFPEQSYFDDFFALPLTALSLSKQKGDLVKSMFDSSDTMHSRWVNTEEEEFYMDDVSEYSEVHDQGDEHGDAAVALALLKSKLADNTHEASRAEIRRTYPKIIQALLRVRLKVVAVNAFLQLRSKGSMLNSLCVSNCDLTGAVTATITHALSDNHNITSLDLSDNEKLLVDNQSCLDVALLLKRSALNTVKLNGCGVNDYGIMKLMKNAMHATSLNTIELSNNYVGSTGANWVATANRVYYVDQLQVKGGFHKKAPFPTADKLQTVGRDHQYIDDYDDELPWRHRYGSSVGYGYREGDQDDEDDDEPYEDTDMYVGEDGEGDNGEEWEMDADDDVTRASSVAYDDDDDEEEAPEVKERRYSVL